MDKQIHQRITHNCQANIAYRSDKQTLDLIAKVAPYQCANSPLSKWYAYQLLHWLFGKNSTDQSVAKINTQYLESQGIKTQSDDDIDLSW